MGFFVEVGPVTVFVSNHVSIIIYIILQLNN